MENTMMRMKRISLCGFLLLSTLAGTAVAQTASPQAGTVRVPVLVSGPKGNPVLNLKQEDFRLFENGVERPIVSFTGPNQPIEIAIIFASGLPKGSRATYGSNSIWDSIDLFKKVGNPANTYTLDERPQGVNGLYDAIWSHVEKLSQSPNPRRALLVITGRELDPAGADAGRKLAVKVRTMGVPIYIRHSAGVCTEEEILALGNCSDKRLVYDQISEYSGGLPLRPNVVAAHDALFLALAEELRDQYVVGFQPAGAPDDKWRDLEIRVTSAAADAKLKAKAPGRHFAAKPR
jgi:hypothetical protein